MKWKKITNRVISIFSVIVFFPHSFFNHCLRWTSCLTILSDAKMTDDKFRPWLMKTFLRPTAQTESYFYSLALLRLLLLFLVPAPYLLSPYIVFFSILSRFTDWWSCVSLLLLHSDTGRGHNAIHACDVQVFCRGTWGRVRPTPLIPPATTAKRCLLLLSGGGGVLVLSRSWFVFFSLFFCLPLSTN